jgi:hypothetical protein
MAQNSGNPFQVHSWFQGKLEMKKGFGGIAIRTGKLLPG